MPGTELEVEIYGERFKADWVDSIPSDEPITVYRQGGVNFLVNEEETGFAADFAAAHGPSACGFAIRFTESVARVFETVKGNGGEALEAFVAIATEGSFTLAAARLHLSQPAVSRRIELLEQELGLPYPRIGQLVVTETVAGDQSGLRSRVRRERVAGIQQLRGSCRANARGPPQASTLRSAAMP